MLRAGTGRRDITPPTGLWMSGYAFRPSGATAVHDNLLVTALVLRDEHTLLVMLSADLICLPTSYSDQIRSNVAAAVGTPVEHVMLHCTHTHGGPYVGTFGCMGEGSPAYEAFLADQCVYAAEDAVAALVPARITYLQAPLQIGINRRQREPDGSVSIGCYEAGAVAPNLHALQVSDASTGSPLCLAFSHACHPTTLGGENLEFTGDWPGEAVRRIEARLPNSRAMALTGCCGDINPYPRGEWADVERAGQRTAMAALSAIPSAQLQPEKLFGEVVELSLPVLPPANLDSARDAVDIWQAAHAAALLTEDQGLITHRAGMAAWARAELARAQSDTPTLPHRFQIQHFLIGDIHLLGFPAEMFVHYQLDFEAQSASPVICAAYTNGCINYLPAAADYADGGYEVAEAWKYYQAPMFAPECEQAVRSAVYSLLRIEDPDLRPYPASAAPRLHAGESAGAQPDTPA
jgi:neutral ceramidase